MMQPMSLIFQLVSTVIIVALKPFSLFNRLCIFGVRSIFIVVQTWIELLRAAIWLHIHIFWSILVWTVAFLSLPSRISNALRRERLLEKYLCEIQIELQNLVWDKKELKDKLNMAMKERKIMEAMLAELEEEHDQAIVKIEQLEGEDLKDQNHRLKEIQGKSSQSYTRQLDTNQKPTNANISTTPPTKSTDKGITVAFNEPKVKTQIPLKAGSKPTDLFSPDPTQVLYRRREVALLQSLFSATLSLVVGVIVLEAEDPCMPLVVALFSVVSMSLKSVVQFFFTIKNKPASDAVALLSFNWFVLGTLTYPTLPKVARILMPYCLRFWMWILWLLGLYS